MKAKRSGQDAQSGQALRNLSWSAIAGGAVVILYALQAANRSEFFSVVSVGLVVSGASLLLGGVLGFLFGIPRTLQHEATPSGPAAEEVSFDYRANTNLEQISDWLTKMLVGVGLTQLTSIPGYLGSLTQYLAAGLGNRPSDSVFALSLLLYFSVVGFLLGYLWTRLYLAGALRHADLTAIGALASRVEQTDRKIDQLKKQSELDVEALNLTYRQLNPGPEVPEVSQDQLNAAVAACSTQIRIQIFNQVWRVRGDNWQTNKPLMELTIPIFRALIRADPDGRYHKNHGQLGFALKDRRQPEWKEAETEFSTAIHIRGPWEDNGWLFYEFNRAICRIMLDAEFAKDKPSEQSTRDAILTDLRAAWQSDLKKLIQKDDLINRWMTTNNLKVSDLREKA